MGATETIRGRIDAIVVAPDRVGVTVTPADGSEVREVALFPLDRILLAQSEGLRRAALLNVAERAFAGLYTVDLVVDTTTRTTSHLRVLNASLVPPTYDEVKIPHPIDPLPDWAQRADG